MAILFGSDAWIKALQAELNQSERYHDAARDWEGDFAFVVRQGEGAPAVHLYMDLWHGECRSAYRAENPGQLAPEFVIEAPLATWRKVVEQKLDPIQGLVTRQLKLRGPLVKVLRAPMAAMILVQCCAHIETEWPEEAKAARPPEMVH